LHSVAHHECRSSSSDPSGISSAQPLPWFCPGRMGDSACRGSCLCWFVRGKLTTPNAPNSGMSNWLPLLSVGKAEAGHQSVDAFNATLTVALHAGSLWLPSLLVTAVVTRFACDKEGLCCQCSHMACVRRTRARRWLCCKRARVNTSSNKVNTCAIDCSRESFFAH
jgi:hypothetical protein